MNWGMNEGMQKGPSAGCAIIYIVVTKECLKSLDLKTYL